VNWNFADAALLAEVVGMNSILSGDNMVVVGLALRQLPVAQRKTASVAGITGAIVIEIAATLLVASALRFPVVECVAGVLLTWIAIRLVRNNAASSDSLNESPANLRHPILSVTTGYLVMCADNVLAVAALARGHPVPLAVGLLLSCALLIPGSLLIADLMRRYPLLVTAGAAVLGWTAGTMMAAVLPRFRNSLESEIVQPITALLMAVIVLTSPLWWPDRDRRKQVNVKSPLRQ
jgi:YjbE family integral membrane protein